MTELVKFEAITDLAQRYGVEAEAFVNTVRAVAMPKQHSTGELISCLLVAREHGLNPLTKEIYFMRTKSGAIQPIVSVDGWIRKANEHPEYDGAEFEVVRNADGATVAMRCSIYRKDRSRPTVVEEDLAECAAGGGPVWKSHPNRMLRNRTFCQAARLAFGFAGLMEPDEFRQWQENLEINGGELVVEVVSPRDGGDLDFRGEAIKRPSSNAAKEAGVADKLAQLESEIELCETVSDLQACFDAFAKDGVPWAAFPRGWASLIQQTYHYKLKDLQGAGGDDGALLRAIEHASTADELQQLWDNDLPEAIKDRISERMSEVA